MTIKKIFLTTGDVDGIGLEITAKTLLSCKSKKIPVRFVTGEKPVQ